MKNKIEYSDGFTIYKYGGLNYCLMSLNSIVLIVGNYVQM